MGGALRGGRAIEGEATVAGNYHIAYINMLACWLSEKKKNAGLLVQCVEFHYLPCSFPFLSVLDTAAGVWLDRNGIVTSSRTIKSSTEFDISLDLMRRCRHASASVGVQIYIYGGLKGGNDFVIFNFKMVVFLQRTVMLPMPFYCWGSLCA